MQKISKTLERVIFIYVAQIDYVLLIMSFHTQNNLIFIANYFDTHNKNEHHKLLEQ